MTYDVLVVGGGPAGLSAALQCRALGRSVMVAGNPPEENPLAKSALVENYLGMPGVSGSAMMAAFAGHALGQEIPWDKRQALGLMPSGKVIYLTVGNDVFTSRTVILATGVSRGVTFSGEEQLLGRGVSYCATCDGMLYRGKPVVVVGKTAHAPEEANQLAKIGCLVTYVAAVRPPKLDPEIPFVAGRKVEIQGESLVTGVVVDGTVIPCQGAFLLRDTVAPSNLAPGIALEGQYIQTGRFMATSIPGVFAAGDCTGGPLQIAKAVGEGMMAAEGAHQFIKILEEKI